MTTLNCAPNTLLVFVDDTGHETLNGQDFYGLGGCAVLAKDYERLVQGPWCLVRLLVKNDCFSPLHATDFGREATQEQIGEVSRFFRDNAFMRIGVAGSSKTVVPDKSELALFVLGCLKRRIVEVAKWTTFDLIAVIFEHSDRANGRVQRYFGDFAVSEDGRQIPARCYFMPKRASEHGLEVADFIANAVGGHARHTLVDKKPGCRKDFHAIFRVVAPQLASFIAIEKVEASTPPAAPSLARV